MRRLQTFLGGMPARQVRPKAEVSGSDRLGNPIPVVSKATQSAMHGGSRADPGREKQQPEAMGQMGRQMATALAFNGILYYDNAGDRALSGRYSCDHNATMATAIPMSKILQKDTSGATSTAQRAAASRSSTTPSTRLVALCQPAGSVCRAHAARPMTATLEIASQVLLMLPAGVAKIALYASHKPTKPLRRFPITFQTSHSHGYAGGSAKRKAGLREKSDCLPRSGTSNPCQAAST